MKRIFLTLTAAASVLLGAPNVRAQQQLISITATPSSQQAAAGGSFNVSLTLSVTQNTAPANVAGFDLYLVTAAANSGYFSITNAAPTGPFNTLGPTNPSGDPLSVAAASGFVRNNINQGFIGTAQATPLTNIGLESLTLSIAPNTPAGTYTLQTSSAANAGQLFTDVTDSNGAIFAVNSPGTFSITVIPEPSTWALLSLGVVGMGLLAVRRRLVA